MYRVVNRKKGKRSIWPLKKAKPRVDERFCEKCGQLHQDGPMPDSLANFISGSVGGLVFPAGTWRRKELTVTFGRWKAQTRQFYLSQYIGPDELRDLAKVLRQTHEYLKANDQQYRSRNRRVH